MNNLVVPAAAAMAGYALGRSGKSETTIVKYRDYDATIGEPDEHLLDSDRDAYISQWRALYGQLLEDYRRLHAIRAEQDDILNLPVDLDTGIVLRSESLLTSATLPYRVSTSGLILHFADAHQPQAMTDMFVRCGNGAAKSVVSTSDDQVYTFDHVRPALFLGLAKTACTQHFRLRGSVILCTDPSETTTVEVSLGEAWQKIRPTADVPYLDSEKAAKGNDVYFPVPPGKTTADYTRVALSSVHVTCAILAPDTIDIAISPLDQAVMVAVKTPYIAFSIASTAIIQQLKITGASRYVNTSEHQLKYQSENAALGFAAASGTEPSVYIASTSTFAGSRSLALPTPRQIDVEVHVSADKTTGLLV